MDNGHSVNHSSYHESANPAYDASLNTGRVLSEAQGAESGDEESPLQCFSMAVLGDEDAAIWGDAVAPVAPAPRRTNHAVKGVKRPRQPPPFYDSDSDEQDREPDLHGWLNDQGYDSKAQIRLCRALASYLAASTKK